MVAQLEEVHCERRHQGAAQPAHPGPACPACLPGVLRRMLWAQPPLPNLPGLLQPQVLPCGCSLLHLPILLPGTLGLLTWAHAQCGCEQVRVCAVPGQTAQPQEVHVVRSLVATRPISSVCARSLLYQGSRGPVYTKAP